MPPAINTDPPACKSVPRNKSRPSTKNVWRTVEKTALKKLRNVLDEIGAEEAADRRVRRIAYGIAGVVLLLLILFVAGLVR